MKEKKRKAIISSKIVSNPEDFPPPRLQLQIKKKQNEKSYKIYVHGIIICCLDVQDCKNHGRFFCPNLSREDLRFLDRRFKT